MCKKSRRRELSPCMRIPNNLLSEYLPYDLAILTEEKFPVNKSPSDR